MLLRRGYPLRFGRGAPDERGVLGWERRNRATSQLPLGAELVRLARLGVSELLTSTV